MSAAAGKTVQNMEILLEFDPKNGVIFAVQNMEILLEFDPKMR